MYWYSKTFKNLFANYCKGCYFIHIPFTNFTKKLSPIAAFCDAFPPLKDTNKNWITNWLMHQGYKEFEAFFIKCLIFFLSISLSNEQLVSFQGYFKLFLSNLILELIYFLYICPYIFLHFVTKYEMFHIYCT